MSRKRKANRSSIADRQKKMNERNSRNPNYVNYRGKYLRPEKVTELAAVQMLFYGKNTPHYKNDPSYLWADGVKANRRLRNSQSA